MEFGDPTKINKTSPLYGGKLKGLLRTEDHVRELSTRFHYREKQDK